MKRVTLAFVLLVFGCKENRFYLRGYEYRPVSNDSLYMVAGSLRLLNNQYLALKSSVAQTVSYLENTAHQLDSLGDTNHANHLTELVVLDSLSSLCRRVDESFSAVGTLVSFQDSVNFRLKDLSLRVGFYQVTAESIRETERKALELLVSKNPR